MQKLPSEKDTKTFHDARMLALNEQVVFPLLQAREELAILQLCEAFNERGTADLSKIAMLAALRSLRADLDNVARMGESAARKLLRE